MAGITPGQLSLFFELADVRRGRTPTLTREALQELLDDVEGHHKRGLRKRLIRIAESCCVTLSDPSLSMAHLEVVKAHVANNDLDKARHLAYRTEWPRDRSIAFSVILAKSRGEEPNDFLAAKSSIAEIRDPTNCDMAYSELAVACAKSGDMRSARHFARKVSNRLSRSVVHSIISRYSDDNESRDFVVANGLVDAITDPCDSFFALMEFAQSGGCSAVDHGRERLEEINGSIHYPLALTNLAKVSKSKKDFDAALEAISGIPEMENRCSALQMLVFAHVESGQIDEARSCAGRIISEFYQVSALSAVARESRLLDDYNKAIDCAKRIGDLFYRSVAHARIAAALA